MKWSLWTSPQNRDEMAQPDADVDPAPNSSSRRGARTVVILEDAAEDIEAARHFHESREAELAIISLEAAPAAYFATNSTGADQ